MLAKTPVSVEEYLQSSFEPDAEYLDGRVVERTVGEDAHSRVQANLVILFHEMRRKAHLRLRPEIRLQVASSRYRVADFAAFRENAPAEPVPSHPPLVVVEILSRDDRQTEVIAKLEEYQHWGVPHIWLVDPFLERLYVYRDRSLQAVSQFEIAGFGITIQAEQLFD